MFDMFMRAADGGGVPVPLPGRGLVFLAADGLLYTKRSDGVVIQLTAGPQGLPGADGAQGVAGPQGLPGADGAPGLPGADGAQGVAGPQGLPGADGAPGLPGADGAQGVAGPKGLPGADGAQGVAGPQGLPGADGAKGVAGPKGPRGLPGADGAPASLLIGRQVDVLLSTSDFPVLSMSQSDYVACGVFSLAAYGFMINKTAVNVSKIQIDVRMGGVVKLSLSMCQTMVTGGVTYGTQQAQFSASSAGLVYGESNLGFGDLTVTAKLVKTGSETGQLDSIQLYKAFETAQLDSGYIL